MIYAWHESAHTIVGLTITRIHNFKLVDVMGHKGWGGDRMG